MSNILDEFNNTGLSIEAALQELEQRINILNNRVTALEAGATPTPDPDPTPEPEPTPEPIGDIMASITDEVFNKQPYETRMKLANKLYQSVNKSFDMSTQDVDSQTFISDFMRTISAPASGYKALEYNVGSHTNMSSSFTPIYNNQTAGDVAKASFRYLQMHQIMQNRKFDLSKDHLSAFMTYTLMNNIIFTNGMSIESVRPYDILQHHTWDRLFNAIHNDDPIEKVVYEHMISIEHWARFRSPEDNGRENLEIYNANFNDDDVVAAATALTNWRFMYGATVPPVGFDVLPYDNTSGIFGGNTNNYQYNTDEKSFEVNYNTTEVTMSDGTKLTNAWEYFMYIVGAKSTDSWTGEVKYLNPKGNNPFDYSDNSARFKNRIVGLIVDIFMPSEPKETQALIVNEIIASGATTFRDIFITILLSKHYLFESDKVKTFEEIFFDVYDKVGFNPIWQERTLSVGSSASRFNASQRAYLKKFAEVNPATGNDIASDYANGLVMPYKLETIFREYLETTNQEINTYKLGRFDVPTDAISMSALQHIIEEMTLKPDFASSYKNGSFKSNFWKEIDSKIGFSGMTLEGSVDACFKYYLGRTPTPDELQGLVSLAMQSSNTYNAYWVWLATFNAITRMTEFYQYSKLNEIK